MSTKQKEYVFLLDDKCFVITQKDDNCKLEVLDDQTVRQKYKDIALETLHAFCFVKSNRKLSYAIS